MKHPAVHVEYPAWVDEVVDWARPYLSDDERMAVAIAVAGENVERGTGGPFGAAIFERESGHLVSVGMNSRLKIYSLSDWTVPILFKKIISSQRRQPAGKCFFLITGNFSEWCLLPELFS